MRTFNDRSEEISGSAIDDELPTRWLRNSIVINRDFSMGLAWKVSFPYLSTMQEEHKDGLYSSLTAMFNALSPNYDVQFIFDQHHDGSGLVADISANTISKNPIANQLVLEKAGMVEKAFGSGRLRFISVYIVLVRKCTFNKTAKKKRAIDSLESSAKKDGKKPGVLQTMLHMLLAAKDAEKYFQYSEKEYDEAVKDLLQVAESVHQTLKGMKVTPEILKNSDVVELFYRVWNPISYDKGGRPRPFREVEQLPLTEYYLKSSLKWSTKGIFELDGVFHRLISVRTPPETMPFTQWDDLLMHRGLHNLRMVMNIQQGSVQKRIKHLRVHRLPQLKSKARKDPTFLQAAVDVERELIALGRDREKIWHVSQVIHVWGKTEDEVMKYSDMVVKFGEEQGGLVLTPEDYNVFGYFQLIQPFWTRDSDEFRQLTYNTSQLVTQLPAIGQATGLGKRLGAVYETSAGSVFNFFPHEDTEFTNANGLVIGGSGTGKSFLVTEMLSQMVRHNPICVIIDLGGSFRAMCEVQGGTYVDMDINSTANRINPLFIAPDHEMEPSDIEQMLVFLEKLVVDPASGRGIRLDKESKAVMEMALNQLIENKGNEEFFIRDYQQILSKYSAGAVLATRLSPWCGKGKYARLFDGTTQLDMTAPFTVFDLSRVADNVELSGVMFATIIQQVAMLGAKYVGRVKFLCFDEAWRILQDPVMASFIVFAYRALRKAGFSTLAISQGIEEFANTENKSAILNNICHRIILRQNSPAAAAALAAEFRLSETEAGYISQLQTVSGQYSQSLISQQMSDGRTRSVIAYTRPSPLAYWCCTTNPNDKKILAEYLGEGMSYTDAIVRLSKDFPQGYSTGLNAKAKVA